MPDFLFDHIHLFSQEPLKAAEFYEKMGAKQVSKRDRGNGRYSVNLNLTGTAIFVSSPADDNAQTGLDHFGIKTNNIEEAVAELKAQGVKFSQEITEVMPGFKIAFFTGPDNVTVELLEGSG